MPTWCRVVVAGGAGRHFDDVVLAAHAPGFVALLRALASRGGALNKNDPLLQTLAAFRYQANDIPHTDTALLPRRRKVVRMELTSIGTATAHAGAGIHVELPVELAAAGCHSRRHPAFRSNPILIAWRRDPDGLIRVAGASWTLRLRGRLTGLARGTVWTVSAGCRDGEAVKTPPLFQHRPAGELIVANNGGAMSAAAGTASPTGCFACGWM